MKSQRRLYASDVSCTVSGKRNNTAVDWQKRESARARLRNLVRITLWRYKYPLDKQEEAMQALAKMHFRGLGPQNVVKKLAVVLKESKD